MNIYNKEICRDLEKLGIKENKSLILDRFDFVPQEYELSFLLGVLDGDGSIDRSGGSKCKNSVQIRLRYFSASYNFIEYIRDTMTRHGFKDVNISKNTRNRKNNFYNLCYSTKDAITFYNESYKNVSIWLPRKREKFESLIDLRISYEKNVKNKNILKQKTI